LIDNACVSDPEKLSVTLTMKFAVPPEVGVPLIWPVELRIRPSGSAPVAIDHA
jgi:hypothetical protein